MTFGDAADREVGTIRLYRTPRILRDGIIVLPGFRIPFYVVIMAFLRSLAYVFTSIVRRPLFTAKNISKWIFRILLGPLLGVFLYSISTLINAAPDAYIIGAMCFAVGFYISPILSKMRDLIYSQLAADKKIEDDLAEIEEDNELIQRLFLSSRVAYFLKRQGIMKVSDLASVSDESLKKIGEQVCMWICPYARIQGVMTDSQTILPAYDVKRGEPRSKLRKGEMTGDGKHGDCIDYASSACRYARPEWISGWGSNWVASPAGCAWMHATR